LESFICGKTSERSGVRAREFSGAKNENPGALGATGFWDGDLERRLSVFGVGISGAGASFWRFATAVESRERGFLIEGGVLELEDELVEAFGEEAFDVIEGLLEVGGCGGFLPRAVRGC